MQLTQHFQLSEFTRSATATRLGIDNTPNEQVIQNLRNLCQHVLEPLRSHINEISPPKQGEQEGVYISSGYRCPSLNKAVGGVKNSQHMTGEACDIHQPDPTKRHDWFLWLMDNTDFDQLILERTSLKPSTVNRQPTYWIHVSCKSDPSKNRHQVLRLVK